MVITQAMRNVVSKIRLVVIIDVILLLTILIVCQYNCNPFREMGIKLSKITRTPFTLKGRVPKRVSTK